MNLSSPQNSLKDAENIEKYFSALFSEFCGKLVMEGDYFTNKS
jgi:hypothetical protein